ncbi:SPOR domain-containing protein [Aliivibrio fischeri]|uniref:SPOR domain-containing protein n=1 Tax=Aliivibrio fischeri TaxID=668 RepID=UPI0012D8B66B|nr:SPOR domain-containing protein [Aliivibrio fischeri]MUK38972.1 SPOR domain-containing protein [Aliivibrio fischeri]MUL07658.1 SPOR domain-containing protein [Aliivibrio fischeri]
MLRYLLLMIVTFGDFVFSRELLNESIGNNNEVYRVQAFALSSIPNVDYKVCSSNVLTLYKVEEMYYLVTDLTTYENAKDIVSFLREECGFKSWIRPQTMDLSFTQDNLAY